MPIRLDSPVVPAPHSVVLPGNVMVSLTMHSTGSANTFAKITYAIDPANDVFFATGGIIGKSATSGPFQVLVPPGMVNTDGLALSRGQGTSVVMLPIALQIQECDAGGAPIGVPQHRNVMIQVS